jgi:hypothetical protein
LELLLIMTFIFLRGDSMKKLVLAVAVWSGVFTGAGAAFAAHPLITDDTGTQGRGNYQVEVNGEYGVDNETAGGVTVRETAYETAVTLSVGVSENADAVIGIPHQGFTVKEDGATIGQESGLSDLSLEYKYRFYDKDGLSLAIKPGLSLPTGDEEKGLGNGKTSYSAYLISTKEAEPWVFHFNVGYAWNEYKLQADKDASRKDIWHLSLASQVEVVEDLTVVVNVGMETNADKTSDTDPAFALGGVIYSLSENVDIDAGVKAGLNDAETDLTVLAGIAVRF